MGIGLTETPDVLNTITVGSSLRFPMVHNTAPNGWQFASYGCRKLDRSAELKFWADYTFQHKSGFRRNFAMTSQETLNTKFSVKELSFTLVTHTVDSDAQFDSYKILNPRESVEHLTYWTDQRTIRF
jgi:hypothetical protein